MFSHLEQHKKSIKIISKHLELDVAQSDIERYNIIGHGQIYGPEQIVLLINTPMYI